ncbi:Hypothetical protein MAU_5220 [Metamycoplasma auris 15026]|uniref:Uncharacterized protein n=1 Tax=Metamycoplasma auris 15026 TaxID=1188233 RepID=N9TRE3_9BACT|nr:Hypothetical protein MAU_5220 [Metamycoplasma auris 15026]
MFILLYFTIIKKSVSIYDFQLQIKSNLSNLNLNKNSIFNSFIDKNFLSKCFKYFFIY